MTQAVSTRDGVGSGLTVMSAFGVFWAILGVSGLDIPNALRIVLVLVAVAVGWALLRAARATRVAHASADAPIPKRSPHSRQIFTWVNVAQGVLIVVASVACGSTGHPAFIAPVICLIVGLHFFTLAYAFGVSLYWPSGAALCAIASVGAILAAKLGPDSQAPFIVVGFAAAITLWTTSLLLARRG